MKKNNSIKRTLSLVLGCALTLPLCLTAATNAYADNQKKTVTLRPLDSSPFNGGEFQGWGTSLCWWANRVGGDDNMTSQAVTAFFSDEGLGLDIGRYNIGGGDNPRHTHITRSDSEVPGMWVDFTLSEDGHDVEITSYDINNDARQLNVAKQALEANPDLYIEGFSNSPPYFMTKSGCVGGGDKAGNNLREDMYDDFAEYIAQSVKLLTDEGIPVQSYSPANEPATAYWSAMNEKQEGCHYDPGERQSDIIVETRRALDEAGLSDIIVAGLDETSIDDALRYTPMLSAEAKEALGRIDTHSYGGSKREELKKLAVEMGKTLWMSEVDGGEGGCDAPQAGSMRGAIGLAQHILEDMNEMQPAAWIMWNIIDCYQDKTVSGDGGLGWFHEDGAFWGTTLANFDTGVLQLSMKYYGLGQFTRYINPGDTIIASSDNTLAAYNRVTGDIKIVAVNNTGRDIDYTFDLSGFTTHGSSVKAYRTSGSMKDGEKWAEIDGIAEVSDSTMTATSAKYSITTYIIEGNGAVSPAYEAASLPEGNYTFTPAITDSEVRLGSDGIGAYIIYTDDNNCLFVEENDTKAGSKVIPYRYFGSGSQSWYAVKNDDGTYSFVGRDSGLALTKSDDGSFMIQPMDSTNAGQKWTLATQDITLYHTADFTNYSSDPVLNLEQLDLSKARVTSSTHPGQIKGANLAVNGDTTDYAWDSWSASGDDKNGNLTVGKVELDDLTFVRTYYTMWDGGSRISSPVSATLTVTYDSGENEVVTGKLYSNGTHCIADFAVLESSGRKATSLSLDAVSFEDSSATYMAIAEVEAYTGEPVYVDSVGITYKNIRVPFTYDTADCTYTLDTSAYDVRFTDLDRNGRLDPYEFYDGAAVVRQSQNRFEVDGKTGFNPFNMGSENENIVKSQAVKSSCAMTVDIPFTLSESKLKSGISLTLSGGSWQVLLDGNPVLNSEEGDEGKLDFTSNTASVSGNKSKITDSALTGSHSLTVNIANSGAASGVKLVHNLPVDGEAEFPKDLTKAEESENAEDPSVSGGKSPAIIAAVIAAALAGGVIMAVVVAAIDHAIKNKKK